MTEESRKELYIIGNLVLNIFRWTALIICVIFAGFTIGATVVSCIYGSSNLSPDLLSRMFAMYTPYTADEISSYITTYGMNKIVVGGIGYGFAMSLNFALLYIIAMKLKKVYKAITLDDNIFSKANINIIDEIIPLSLIFSFAYPILMFIISSTTKMFAEYQDFSYGGLIILFVTGILKVIFERGYSLQKENIMLNKELDDYKSDITEEKIAEAKEEKAQIKEEKTQIKEEEKQSKKRRRSHKKTNKTEK